MLADVAVRLDLKFPYRIKDRIKAAKEIVDRPEYEPYRDTTFIACAMSFFDTRTSATSWLMLSWNWRPIETRHPIGLDCDAATGKFRPLTLEFSVEDLREQANQMLKYLSDAHAVFQKFYKELETS